MLDRWQQLQTVRRAYPVQQRMINGSVWRYISAGEGPALLLLPGGLAVSETAFQYILAFVPQYRVFAPTYPANLTTIAAVVDSLAALLQAEGITQAHVIGGSYSGLIAQCLVRRHPALVADLILSDTGIPRPARARRYRLLLPLLQRLPLGLIHLLLRLGTHQALADMGIDRSFWQAYFAQTIPHLSRADCVSHLQLWLDFDQNYRFSCHDLSAWKGRMLLIAATHDRLFPPSEQRGLLALYPQATVHAFADHTHSASLDRMNEYIGLIEQFLQPTYAEVR